MTFWDTVAAGEYVMIAEAVILILCLCLWWVRSAKLGYQKKSYPALMQRVRDHVVEGDIENARQLCGANPYPGARVIESGLSRVGKSMPEVLDAMQQTSIIEKDAISAGARWLRSLAVVSPLLGLGGTLVGIVRSLRDLGQSQSPVDLEMICSQIAPTIVTTVAGLGVGIVALVAFTCLESKIGSSARNLDELTSEFTDLLNEPS